MKRFKKLFTVTIRCYWCGNLVPVVQNRPTKCPYCGGTL